MGLNEIILLKSVEYNELSLPVGADSVSLLFRLVQLAFIGRHNGKFDRKTSFVEDVALLIAINVM